MLRLRRLGGALAAALALVAACSGGSADRTPTILDYSPTVSDVGALVYLLSHPGMDVVAVTLPATGEAGCDLGVDITLGILALFERTDIPVACDDDRPSHAEAWPADFVADGAALLTPLPVPVAHADTRSAPDVIAAAARDEGRPVVLVAVAPLTNVARALDTHPDLVDRLERIVVMGGALDVPGNVPGTAAEWNLWIDAPAAARVLAAPLPITLVPLDATNDVPTPPLWELQLAETASTPASIYVEAVVRASPAVTSGAFYMWDELAAAVAAGETTVELEEVALIVGDLGQPGQTLRDDSGNTLLVVTGVPDAASFYGHFLTTIGGARGEPLPTSAFTDREPPPPIDAASPARDVVAFWLAAALNGDTEAATSVVAPGAPWVGFGDSHEVFVAGSGPFEVTSIEMTCTQRGDVASCEATWRDSWIDANPDVEAGWMRVQGVVAGSHIEAFDDLTFSPEVVAAFDAHLAWLAVALPQRFAAECGANAASPTCSALLAETAGRWVAHR